MPSSESPESSYNSSDASSPEEVKKPAPKKAAPKKAAEPAKKAAEPAKKAPAKEAAEAPAKKAPAAKKAAPAKEAAKEAAKEVEAPAKKAPAAKKAAPVKEAEPAKEAPAKKAPKKAKDADEEPAAKTRDSVAPLNIDKKDNLKTAIIKLHKSLSDNKFSQDAALVIDKAIEHILRRLLHKSVPLARMKKVKTINVDHIAQALSALNVESLPAIKNISHDKDELKASSKALNFQVQRVYRRVKAYVDNKLTLANPARFYISAAVEAMISVLLPVANEHMVRDNKKTLMPNHVVTAMQSCTELQQVFSTLPKDCFKARDFILPEDADIDLSGFAERPAPKSKGAAKKDEDSASEESSEESAEESVSEEPVPKKPVRKSKK